MAAVTAISHVQPCCTGAADPHLRRGARGVRRGRVPGRARRAGSCFTAAGEGGQDNRAAAVAGIIVTSLSGGG